MQQKKIDFKNKFFIAPFYEKARQEKEKSLNAYCLRDSHFVLFHFENYFLVSL